MCGDVLSCDFHKSIHISTHFQSSPHISTHTNTTSTSTHTFLHIHTSPSDCTCVAIYPCISTYLHTISPSPHIFIQLYSPPHNLRHPHSTILHSTPHISTHFKHLTHLPHTYCTSQHHWHTSQHNSSPPPHIPYPMVIAGHTSPTSHTPHISTQLYPSHTISPYLHTSLPISTHLHPSPHIC